MHVMQITTGQADPDGVLLYAAEAARRLAGCGHRVSMLTPPDGWISNRLSGSRVRLVPSTLDKWPLGELRRIRDDIRRHAVDVVHTHGNRAHTFGVLLRRLYGIPCVAHAHRNRQHIHWAANDHVIAVSEATRQHHIWTNLVLPSRITTVHNPVDTHRFCRQSPTRIADFRQELQLPQDARLIGVLGTVRRGKGQRYAVEAMPSILKAFPETHLLIVGAENARYANDVRRRIEQLKIGGRVHWVPYRDDAPTVLSALDVCLVPSLEEPFGFVAPESLVCGTPVVASRVGGLQETIQHERTGLLVQPRSAAELAAGTLRFLGDPRLASQYTSAGAAWVRSQLTPHQHFRQVTTILARVAGALDTLSETTRAARAG
ncbi:MAG: glycosyltransferase family 4 protein [Pirellulaceae bacterium]